MIHLSFWEFLQMMSLDPVTKVNFSYAAIKLVQTKLFTGIFFNKNKNPIAQHAMLKTHLRKSTKHKKEEKNQLRRYMEDNNKKKLIFYLEVEETEEEW